MRTATTATPRSSRAWSKAASIATTIAKAHRRARQLANALESLGRAVTDRVGTLAWNGFRHFEIYYAVSGHRRVVPHHQSAPVSRADRLHHQPCRRPVRVRRSDFRSAGREDRDHCKGVHGWVVMTDNAQCRRLSPTCCATRIWSTRTRTTTSGPIRRWNDGRPVLHLGHDRQPKGCALLAPLDCAARLRGVPSRCHEPVGPRRGDAGGADVPRQCLGPALCSLRAGRLSSCSRGGRLDGASLYELFEKEKVTMSAGVPTVWLGLLHHVKQNNLQVHDAHPHRDRRLGLPAGHDPQLPGRVRRAGPARLGHDGAVAAGHAVHAQSQAAELCQRTATPSRTNRGARSTAWI